MKNWKTTLIGVGTAFVYATISYLQGGMDLKSAAIAAGIALLGSFSKDHNVTGGTSRQ